LGPTACAKTRQCGASADQPREKILELGELDLPFAFTGAGPPREDIENQLRAIDDLAVEPLLELSELGWRQLVVEDDEVDTGFRARCRQRGRLAAADIRSGIRLGPVLHHPKHDDGPRAFG
jgi:hypothetical protein